MKIPLILIIAIILFASCSKKSESSFILKKNGEIKQLTFSSKFLEGSNIGPKNKYGYIYDIHFIGNYLYMSDIKSDSIFLTYNMKGELQKYFSIGAGPNQFVSPEFLKITSINDLSDVQVFEYRKGIYQLNFKNNQKTSLFSLENDRSASAIQSIAMMGKEKLALVDIDPHTKFTIVNLNTKETRKINQNISSGIKNADQYYLEISPKGIGFNKKHNILFTWNSFVNTVDLYNTNGDLVKSYSYGTNQNLENNKFERKYFYYYNLKSKGDYIYGIYGGFNVLENFTEALIPVIKTELHIFNIRTDQIHVYKFDRFINVCAIDFTNNTLYCIEENSESQPLVKYEIN